MLLGDISRTSVHFYHRALTDRKDPKVIQTAKATRISLSLAHFSPVPVSVRTNIIITWRLGANYENCQV